LEHVLAKAGHEVTSKANAEDATSQEESAIRSFDVAVLDWDLPGQNGLELGQQLFYLNPRLFLIMVTAFGSLEKKMQATRYGGFVHFISKPGGTELLSTLKYLEPEVQQRRESLEKIADAKYGIVGRSSAMLRLQQQIAIVGRTDANVLVLGESGTGKELIAAALHKSSQRNKRPYVPINCAAFSENLLESEVFGHEKGAFTGAHRKKSGRVEEAKDGTLFLDEIGDMSSSLQAKLLRFIEDGTYTTVGGNMTLHVNVRLIAATERDLVDAIAKDKFREALFHRLNVVQLRPAPLRERRDDIPLLANHFLQQFRVMHDKKKVAAISPTAMRLLVEYRWPGNVRELRNAIEHAVIFDSSAEIQPTSLPDSLRIGQEASTSSVSQRGVTIPATIGDSGTAITHDMSVTANDLAKILSYCGDILSTGGASIKNDADTIYNDESPQFLKLVLAAFYAEFKAKRVTLDQFNKLFGLKSGKRQSTEIRQYLQQLTRNSPNVFKPYSGTNQYGVRDLVADGTKLREQGFIMPEVRPP
jgi:two-component system response regulator HydG